MPARPRAAPTRMARRRPSTKARLTCRDFFAQGQLRRDVERLHLIEGLIKYLPPDSIREQLWASVKVSLSRSLALEKASHEQSCFATNPGAVIESGRSCPRRSGRTRGRHRIRRFRVPDLRAGLP